MNQGFTHRETIARESAGNSILAHLGTRYPHSSVDAWRERFARGEVTLNGVVAGESELLRAGQLLAWNRPGWEEPPAPVDLAVLYEDRWIVAVAKPAGLPTLPGAGFLENTLLSQLKRRFPDAAPAHRLGRWTSGVVICPRGREAAARVIAAWGSCDVEKVYRALASGTVRPDQVEMATPIGLVEYPPLGKLHAANPEGRRALSTLRVLERRPNATLVEVRITTGRPHQIRIHLAAAGHPLVGDPLYGVGGLPLPGCRAVPGDPGYSLHAWRVTLPHPFTRKGLEVRAEPPAELSRSVPGG